MELGVNVSGDAFLLVPAQQQYAGSEVMTRKKGWSQGSP
jgi:hypothetical protein